MSRETGGRNTLGNTEIGDAAKAEHKQITARLDQKPHQPPPTPTGRFLGGRFRFRFRGVNRQRIGRGTALKFLGQETAESPITKISLVSLKKQASDSTHVAGTCAKLAEQKMITADNIVINNELSDFYGSTDQWRAAIGITLLPNGKKALSNVA